LDLIYEYLPFLAKVSDTKPRLGGGLQVFNLAAKAGFCEHQTPNYSTAGRPQTPMEMAAPSVPMKKWFVPARNGDSFIQS
jgi:hypothetical protein